MLAPWLKARGPDCLALLLAAAASLMLLLFVAYSATVQTYGETQQRTAAAAAGMLKEDIEGQLKAGVALDGIIGLTSMLDKLIVEDGVVASASIQLPGGETLAAVPGTSGIQARAGASSQISLALQDRFAQAGLLVVEVDGNAARATVFNHLVPVFGLAGLAALAAAVSALTWPASSGRIAMMRVGIAFAVVSIVMASTMVSIFSEAVRAQGHVIAASVSQRLAEIPRTGIALEDISGIEGLLGEYRRANPELDSIRIMIGGRQVHLSGAGNGLTAEGDRGRFVFRSSAGSYGPGSQVEVVATMPRQVVLNRVLRNLKDFAALFVACIIITSVMLSASSSIRGLAVTRAGDEWPGQRALMLAKPAFFAAVATDFLNYATLPGIARERAMAAGLDAGMAALPFTIYFVAFALVLVPAKMAIARLGARIMLAAGLVGVAAGSIGIALSEGFTALVICRLACGLGQGVVLIAAQDLLFAGYSAKQRGQAGASIVIGFQTAMIAGVALGSLLAASIGSDGVFLLSGAVAAFTALAMVWLMPAAGSGRVARDATAPAGFRQGLRPLMRDRVFLSASFLAGIPAKAALSGVVIFALPLVLAESGFSVEEIGQVTMVYACAVAVSSHLVSRKWIARFARLSVGAGIVLGAAGIAALGILAGTPVETHTLAMIGAVMTIGLAHGFIYAPVVVLVSAAPAAKVSGASEAATVYRLIERAGHALGPVIAAQLMSFAGSPGEAMKLFAAGTAALGAGFLLLMFMAGPHRLEGGQAA